MTLPVIHFRHGTGVRFSLGQGRKGSLRCVAGAFLLVIVTVVGCSSSPEPWMEECVQHKKERGRGDFPLEEIRELCREEEEERRWVEECIQDKRVLGLTGSRLYIETLCRKDLEELQREAGEAEGKAAWDACFAKWGEDACREEFQRWPGWAQEKWYLAPPSDEWMRRAGRQRIDKEGK